MSTDQTTEGLTRQAAERQRQTDFNDLQHELSGVETGRIRRFLPESAQAMAQDKRNSDSAMQTLTLLQLLQNPAYAELYRNVETLLSRAELLTEQALQHFEEKLQLAEQDIQEIRDQASRLPDGTAVFRDAQGNVWTEDGKQVDAEQAQSIVWKPGAPSYEEFRRRKQDVEDYRRQIDELRIYQVDVLGAARNRMEDQDNPPSKEELQGIQQEIEDKAPAAIAPKLDVKSEEPKPETTMSHQIAVPKMF